LTNYTFSGLTGFINQTAWEVIEDGVIPVRFYVNDSLGHIGFKEVEILKDTINPDITIHSPFQDKNFGTIGPPFNISIIEEHLEATWYTIDGGLTNYSFSGLTGFINQTAWNLKEDSVINVRFYANDSLGHIGFKDVQILKDTINPVITIHAPLDEDVFGKKGPEFNISIFEENLESMWYTIENISGNFHFTELIVNIDQDGWTAVSQGNITITFYAQDGAGNIGMESVIVIKKIPFEIPGYNLLFLLGVLALVTIFLSQKLKKFSRLNGLN
jgi:hypothetical protein